MYHCTNMPYFKEITLTKGEPVPCLASKVRQWIEAKLDEPYHCVDGKKAGRWLRTSIPFGWESECHYHISFDFEQIEWSHHSLQLLPTTKSSAGESFLFRFSQFAHFILYITDPKSKAATSGLSLPDFNSEVPALTCLASLIKGSYHIIPQVF
jgi:hypothetical protein